MENKLSKKVIGVSGRSIQDFSDEELLQFFVPEKAAVHLVSEYQSLYDAVMNSSVKELEKLAGVGKARILKLESLQELVRRFQREKSNKITKVRSAEDVFDYLEDMQYLKQEQFRVILLNTKNDIIGQKIITQGTVSATLISPREIFNAAIKHMASVIILVHNHPSGNCEPSQEDFDTTRNIVQAGVILGVHVLDHVIIGKNTHYSFRQHCDFE